MNHLAKLWNEYPRFRLVTKTVMVSPLTRPSATPPRSLLFPFLNTFLLRYSSSSAASSWTPSGKCTCSTTPLPSTAPPAVRFPYVPQLARFTVLFFLGWTVVSPETYLCDDTLGRLRLHTQQGRLPRLLQG
jgi:hypothetical protein